MRLGFLDCHTTARNVSPIRGDSPTRPESGIVTPYVGECDKPRSRDRLFWIVLNEAHLVRILKGYLTYYHESRPHLSLDRNAPVSRRIESAQRGKVIAIPQLGGVHHRYARAAGAGIARQSRASGRPMPRLRQLD